MLRAHLKFRHVSSRARFIQFFELFIAGQFQDFTGPQPGERLVRGLERPADALSPHHGPDVVDPAPFLEVLSVAHFAASS